MIILENDFEGLIDFLDLMRNVLPVSTEYLAILTALSISGTSVFKDAVARRPCSRSLITNSKIEPGNPTNLYSLVLIFNDNALY